MEVNRLIDVLLVEDDSQSADLVVTAAEMAKTNFRFHFATDGVAALDYLHRRSPNSDAPSPDLILLDLNLPVLSGREVLADIKKNGRLKNIPVVLLTASDYFKDLQDEFGLADVCCYTKPNRFKAYIELMQNLEKLYHAGALAPKEKAGAAY